MKTVGIIGAGPSGLVAAKTLTHDHKGSFHVTVFEQSHRIGGLWPISNVDDGMVHPEMCTNQSRHTVSFSDLAWPETSPSFPKAWQVGQYLERYIKTYPGYKIRLNTRVSKTELLGGKWRVNVQETLHNPETLEFDHLIVASGFFGKPKVPQHFEHLNVPVLHSSKVRDVKDLLTDSGKRSAQGRKIVVVGGQMSGVEIAGTIAFQISSAANTPAEPAFPDPAKYVVTHLVQKPTWVMPFFFPNNPEIEADGDQVKKNPSPNFLPLDLVSYNLGWRPPGPVANTSGHITPEGANMSHDFMEKYIGSDQCEFGIPVLSMTGKSQRSEPPYLACSDNYHEFIRQGKIEVMKGRMVSSVGDGESTSIEIKGESEVEKFADVAAIVLATGFDASPSLKFLPTEVLHNLQFDPDDDGFPLALNVHTTVNKSVSSLGFVGFYRSPYWGVMEMQARYLAQLWSGNQVAAKALEDDTTLESMMKLRKNPRRSQFPMGDYAYLMESLSEIVGTKRVDPEGAQSRTGLVLPFRYINGSADDKQKQEATLALTIVQKLMHESATNAKFVARAVFKGMQGIWNLERHIDSRHASFPSGVLNGIATMSPRSPTHKTADMEYLYFEKGDFKPSWGGTMHAKRSYVYHYTEVTDKMEVWFAKADYKTSDYFFHQLEFVVPEKAGLGGPWRANSSHLCIEDMYDVTYEFYFSGATLTRWTSEYTVKGPNKDYIISNVYTRPTS